MGKELSIRKYIPGFLGGAKCDRQTLSQDVVDHLDTDGGVPADGSITPDKLDRPYIEATFGEEAEGEPPGVLRQILRIWIQDDKLFGESDDEF